MAGGTGPFAGVTATTDVAGRYRFPHVGTNLTVVTAQAPGRAPDAREVLVREGLGPVDFKLSPGRRLNLRLADPGGAPVAGAAVAAWQWRGREYLSWRGRTGPDGHLAAADLPADAVTFSITARGKMGIQVELTAGDAEQIVRLPPALHVHGAVVDAETGQSLPRVRVMSGFDLGDGTGTRWDNPAPTVAAGGRYARTFTAPMTAYQLRFEADGYLPETSRPFKSGEGDVVSDVKLRRRTAPAVVVVDGDGNPVEGVEVAALGVGQADVIVEEGHINSWFGRSVPSKSRFDGRVDLDLPVGDFVLLAVGEQGYVSVPSKQLPADTPPRLVLKPWARLTGRTLSGGKPVVGQVVLIRSVRTLRSGDLSLTATVSSHAVSDAQGRFELKRCVTGPGTAARTVMHADRNMMTEEPLANVDVRPPPDVSEVTLGVGGRAVRAKVIPPDDFPADWASNFECMAFLQTVAPPLPLPKNWLAMDEGQRRAWTEQFKQTDAGREWARQQPGEAGFRMVILGRDGTVRLDDVPPGSYVLTAQTSEPHWARLVHEFTVAEAAPGKDEAPVDLGNLELLPRSWPKGATRPAAPKR
jgi:hypothetical protein